MAETTGWAVHAAGERQVSASTHVGYLVFYPGVRHDLGSAILPLLGFYAMVYTSPIVLCLLLWRPRLWRWFAGLGLVAAAWAGWMMTRWTADSSYVEAMATMERYSAEIEAQAAAEGRWPDLQAWNVAHQPRDLSPMFAYSACRVVALRPEPWAALSVRADNIDLPERRFLDGYPRTKMDSRLFGPDGVYGTADDDPRLRYALSRWRQHPRVWPHGRAPRDPNVKLPPWPAPAQGTKP
ncbi:MAG: hypothetical protein HZB16_16235 [Armatimonadetes bacterium]|nr:hypothetical protein [Armatimonadota bacterium]